MHVGSTPSVRGNDFNYVEVVVVFIEGAIAGQGRGRVETFSGGINGCWVGAVVFNAIARQTKASGWLWEDDVAQTRLMGPSKIVWFWPLMRRLTVLVQRRRLETFRLDGHEV